MSTDPAVHERGAVEQVAATALAGTANSTSAATAIAGSEIHRFLIFSSRIAPCSPTWLGAA
jgi:hypothetical protein